METNNNDLLQRIRAMVPELSKSQRRLADYVLANYEKAAYMTGAALGDQAGVSEPTVVRFAHLLGYDGYPQFKKALQNMLKVKLTTTQRIEMFSDFETGSIAKKAILADMDNLKSTLMELSAEHFEKAVEWIAGANRIFIAGFRTSTLLSNYLGYYLGMIAGNVVVLDHGLGDIYEKLVKLEEGDVFIGISFPRYSVKTREVAAYVRSKGGKIIAITDNEKSPLGQEGDLVLVARSNIMAFVDSITAPISLINGLIIGVGYRNKNKTSQVFDELERVWADHDVFQNENDQESHEGATNE
jgi:DNA-binding MurR/RpiR family transcriptional regulator